MFGGVRAGAVQPEGKLVEFYEDGRPEQYNLKDDPGERTNLARRLPQKAAELHAPLKRWRASVKAVMPSPNPGYDAAKAFQGVAVGGASDCTTLTLAQRRSAPGRLLRPRLRADRSLILAARPEAGIADTEPRA